MNHKRFSREINGKRGWDGGCGSDGGCRNPKDLGFILRVRGKVSGGVS